MKEKLSVILLLLILIAVLCRQYALKTKIPVLKVITPVMFQADLNANNMFDEGETICVNGVRAFTSNLSHYSDSLADEMKLPYDKAVAVGYLADGFANSILVGNSVKLNFTGEVTPECRYADILVEDKDYGKLLFEQGLGIALDGAVSDAYKNVLSKANTLKLAIINHKSGKYHTLDCKYGKAAHDTVVLEEREIPKNALPCKFCHLSKTEQKHIDQNKTILPPPNIITDGNFKLILTDFTTILKPDRSCNHAVCREFVKQIDNSKETIDIALYGWANIPKVNTALENASKRGVMIRIVYDTSLGKENYYTETEDFVKKCSNVRSDNIDGDKKLTNMLMHNKFAIFDRKVVYTGSMNFSTTGFSGFNHNNVLVINSAEIAGLYTEEFNRMYSGKFHTLKEKSANNTGIKSGSSLVSVFFSPQDKGIINGVIPLVRSAKDSVLIPTFILTHDELFNELAAAKKRGVDVRVIIDATSTGVTHSKVKLMRQSGIPVKAENYAGKMHAKAMIIDGRYLVLGSANFSNSAENKNDENMVVIDNKRLANFYKDYFEYFWAKIPDKYLKYNVSAESRYSIGSCNDGIDNDFDNKIDLADDGCKPKTKQPSK